METPNFFVTIEQAWKSIMAESERRPIQSIALQEAMGHFLANDLFSPIDMPPFHQSAMDGYAVHIHNEKNYKIIGEVKAGDRSNFELQPGEGVRIFTGGMVPNTANCVIKQEDVTTDKTHISVNAPIKAGDHIRLRGEQIQEGAVAMKKGMALNAGTMGFLATLGITSVHVHQKPNVAIVTTGNELVAPGKSLEPGQVYESNRLMLETAMRNEGISCNYYEVKDDFNQTKNTISEALKMNDFLIITGGISVGNYDFVGRALEEIGVTAHFYKVKQKPGKPLFFGTKKEKIVFALPGNPGAALSCYYLYVKTALRACLGSRSPLPDFQQGRLLGEYSKRSGLTHFLKAKAKNGMIEVLEGQSSAMLRAFTEANGLVMIPEETTEVQEGSEVEWLNLG